MKTCQSYQQEMNYLAGGNEIATTAPADLESLMAHATVCPACSNHAISALVLVNGPTLTAPAPSKKVEEALFGKLDRIDSRSPWPLIKAAAVLLVAISTFAMGRWSSPTPAPVVKEIVVSEQLEQEELPAIAFDRHEYGDGFLAGRSFVVHRNN